LKENGGTEPMPPPRKIFGSSTRAKQEDKAMSFDYHSFPTRTTQVPPLLGFGTAHAGPEWSTAVRALRAAISAAKVVAPYRVKPTGEAIAEAVIDHIDQLNARDRVVLAAVLGILFRKTNGNS
jgi:hypothetical protein